MRAPNDWRLTNQEKYLKSKTLVWRKYVPADTENDHDHCEFCWRKFTKEGLTDALAEGFSTTDGYRWIGKTCFDDFVDLFEWDVNDPLNVQSIVSVQRPL